jgi:apolipoprotein N-acyltransferase
LLSVTGLSGITFLIGWFAVVGNRLWEAGFASPRIRTQALVCAAVIAAAFLLGGARMALFPPSASTVRVASLSKRDIGPKLSRGVIYRLFFNQVTPTDMEEVKRWSAARSDDLLARTEREMQAGARIVFWGEANARLVKPDEVALLARGRALAEKYHAYLGMGLGVWNLGKTPPFENKVVLIEPDGQVAWTYNKIRPVPGLNATMQIRGDGRVHTLDTLYGRLGAIICADADYPRVPAQAGRLGADIVLDPSNDWSAIDPLHTRMASFRAIEQGFNLVRQASGGLSAAFDYQGRRLAAVDDPLGTGPTMISEVPSKGVRTIYSRLGDWFAWLSMAVLLILIAKSLASVPKHDAAAAEANTR